MTDWGTTAGICQGALANIINECELPSAQQMPQTTLASIAAYARDVLERIRPAFVPGRDEASHMIVPTGTGWPVTSSVHDWDAEAAEREQYADVMAADLADRQKADQLAARRDAANRYAWPLASAVPEIASRRAEGTPGMEAGPESPGVLRSRTAEPVRERYIIGPDGATYGPFAPRVPTGTGWPVTR